MFSKNMFSRSKLINSHNVANITSLLIGLDCDWQDLLHAQSRLQLAKCCKWLQNMLQVVSKCFKVLQNMLQVVAKYVASCCKICCKLLQNMLQVVTKSRSYLNFLCHVASFTLKSQVASVVIYAAICSTQFATNRTFVTSYRGKLKHVNRAFKCIEIIEHR